jgi:hypothetical protein
MKNQDLIDKFNSLSLTDQSDLLRELKYAYSDNFNAKYKKVSIYNRDGYISDKISSETGYQCYHVCERSGYIGENVVLIEHESFTAEIESKLKEAYDDVA